MTHMIQFKNKCMFNSDMVNMVPYWELMDRIMILDDKSICEFDSNNIRTDIVLKSDWLIYETEFDCGLVSFWKLTPFLTKVVLCSEIARFMNMNKVPRKICWLPVPALTFEKFSISPIFEISAPPAALDAQFFEFSCPW